MPRATRSQPFDMERTKTHTHTKRQTLTIFLLLCYSPPPPPFSSSLFSSFFFLSSFFPSATKSLMIHTLFPAATSFVRPAFLITLVRTTRARHAAFRSNHATFLNFALCHTFVMTLPHSRLSSQSSSAQEDSSSSSLPAQLSLHQHLQRSQSLVPPLPSSQRSTPRLTRRRVCCIDRTASLSQVLPRRCHLFRQCPWRWRCPSWRN